MPRIHSSPLLLILAGPIVILIVIVVIQTLLSELSGDLKTFEGIRSDIRLFFESLLNLEPSGKATSTFIS